MRNAVVLAGRGRVHRTREEIALLLRDYRASGLTQSAFARARGLSLSTLSSWLRRSRSKGELDEPQRLVPVRITDDAPRLPVQRAMDFELSVGGTCLKIPADFDADALRRLLPLLTERC